MNSHAPHRQRTLPDGNTSALILSPSSDNIWASSVPAQSSWTEAPERVWSQNRASPLGSRDPLQPSHNIPTAQVRDAKEVSFVPRGDMLTEYQHMKEDVVDQSRRSRVGAIGEGRGASGKPQNPMLPYGYIHDSIGPSRDRTAPSRFNGLSLDLSSLHISNSSPASSPQDGTSTFVSTPSNSVKSNTPTTPQDPHGSFSSIPSAKSLDEDPTVWVNPSFKGNSRYTTAHVERGLDDARFHDPSRSIRSTSSSAYDFNDETFRFHPPTSGGMYEVGPPMDDLNQGAVQRARAQRDFPPNVPPFSYSSSWLGPRELEEASLVNPFGASDSYSHINASNPDYPYPTPSPYTSLRPDLSPSPANLSSQLPAVNAPYPPPKGMVPSTQRSGSLPIIQAPYNDTYPSQTPRALPGSMLPPHLTTGSAVVRGESLHDLPHHPGHEHPSYSAPFETYMQARRTSLAGPPPTSTSTGSLSPESGARSVQRPAGPAHHEPINFLQMLQPTATPPYDDFVNRIVMYSDQQASVFLQQKMKVASATDRLKIVTAIANRGLEMMTHRFGNWAVQRCLESPCTREDRSRLVAVMEGHVVELATNCYGTHVIQKALDCEQDIKLLVLTELLMSDPYATLMNKHAAHVWSRIMELNWPEPAPPIFQCVNNALKGRWVDLACHETGSLVVQHAFENLDEADTRDLVGEVLQHFDRIVCDPWGSWVVQHLLEHGAEDDRSRALGLLLEALHIYSTDAQAYKSIEKAIKCGGPEVLDRIVSRLCEPGSSKRRAMLVDLALNSVGSQLIAQILPSVNKEQGTTLYDSIKKHVVTLKGSKSGSRVTWLFDKMRAYYGY